MDTQENNPLRGPWTYASDMDSVIDWYGKRAGGNGVLGEDGLLPPEQQTPEIAAAMNLLATLEVKS